jgi:hypothetical protein
MLEFKKEVKLSFIKTERFPYSTQKITYPQITDLLKYLITVMN